MRKVIVAGSRTLDDYELVEQTLAEIYGDEAIEIVSGTQVSISELDWHRYGANYLGEVWALRRSLPITKFPPDWLKYGKAAWRIRNQQMAEYATDLVAFWDGMSKGTADMIARAARHGLNIEVKIFKQ